MKGNYRNQSKVTVFIFFLLIVVCYAGLLYTWINQQNDEAEAYGRQPWSSTFNAAGGAPQSIAPISNPFSSSSPTFTYRHRSARGIHISSGGGVHRFGVPVPTGGTGFRVYNSAGANAGASSTSYAFRSTTHSVGSSTSGITLTSDALLHSYGGGNAAGSGMQGASSQSRSAQGNATGGGSLSMPVLTVSLPVYTLAYTPTTIGTDADKQAAAAAMASAQWQQHTGFSGSGAIFSSPISSPYRTVNGVSSFLSADEYLAHSQTSTSGKRYAPPQNTIGNSFLAWLKTLEGTESNYLYCIDGVYYFSEQGLRALFEAAQSSGHFPGLTWEEFLSWFSRYSADEGATYKFPVGEPWTLLILAVLYAVFLLWRRSPHYMQRP